MIKEIDEIDLNILTHLQADAKIKMKDLSKKVHLSISAISKRIIKLEELNVIKRYAVVLNHEKLGLRFAIDLGVKLISNTSENLRIFKEKILEIHEVISCSTVCGTYDLMLKVLARNPEEYRGVYNKLSSIAGVISLSSCVIVEEIKENTGANLAGFLKKVPKQRKGNN